MFNFLPTSKEPNLAKAGNFLVIEFAVGVTLTFALGQLGLPAGEDAVFIGFLLFNLLPAFYIAKAARAQGKSALFYGVVSALPPGALLSFFSLKNNEFFAD